MLATTLANEVVAAAEVTTVVTPAVNESDLFMILNALARDVDSAISTSIEIGIMAGTKKIPIDSSPGSFGANISHNVFWPAVLQPGDKVYATFTTPSAGDHLQVIAHGIVYPIRAFLMAWDEGQCGSPSMAQSILKDPLLAQALSRL